MAKPIVKELQRLEDGMVVFDAHLQKEVLLITPVLAVLGDNPRHSELLNHAGSSSNKYYRMCMVKWRVYHAQTCIIIMCNPCTGGQNAGCYSCSSCVEQGIGPISH